MDILKIVLFFIFKKQPEEIRQSLAVQYKLVYFLFIFVCKHCLLCTEKELNSIGIHTK